MGRAIAQLFCCPTIGSVERGESKGIYHYSSITKSISKIFIFNFVCVLSQKNAIKHIELDFHSVALVMPKG